MLHKNKLAFVDSNSNLFLKDILKMKVIFVRYRQHLLFNDYVIAVLTIKENTGKLKKIIKPKPRMPVLVIVGCIY